MTKTAKMGARALVYRSARQSWIPALLIVAGCAGFPQNLPSVVAGAKCPSGTKIKGNAPPKGHEIWCQDAEGRMQGPYVKWADEETAKAAGKDVILEAGMLKDGEKNGAWLMWDESGRPISEGTYTNGQQNGHWKAYVDGIAREEGDFKAGKQTGMWTYWHPNGNKGVEVMFKDGLRDGVEKVWTDEGKLLYEAHNLAGKKEGHYLEFYPESDGKKHRDCNYKDSKLEGQCTTWDEDGTLLESGPYAKGNKSGDWIEFDPKTNTKEAGPYVEGKRDGTWVTTIGVKADETAGEKTDETAGEKTDDASELTSFKTLYKENAVVLNDAGIKVYEAVEVKLETVKDEFKFEIEPDGRNWDIHTYLAIVDLGDEDIQKMLFRYLYDSTLDIVKKNVDEDRAEYAAYRQLLRKARAVDTQEEAALLLAAAFYVGNERFKDEALKAENCESLLPEMEALRKGRNKMKLNRGQVGPFFLRLADFHNDRALRHMKRQCK